MRWKRRSQILSFFSHPLSSSSILVPAFATQGITVFEQKLFLKSELRVRVVPRSPKPSR